MQYISLSDARRRLEGCVIQYEGQPVYVNRVYGPEPEYDDEGDPLPGELQRSYQMQYTPLTDAEEKSKAITSDITEQTIKPPKVELGFINCHKANSALLLRRFPSRHTRLGLCTNNVNVFDITGTLYDKIDVSFNNVYMDKGFFKALIGEYPSVIDAANTESMTAFDRKFAFWRKGYLVSHLYYYEDQVGEFDIRNREFIIYKPFKYLSDSLSRTLLKKGELYVIRQT